MNLILIMGVSVAFLAAILTGGYEDKGNSHKSKKSRGHQPT
ncbi:hypothetical protein [Sporosarcina sp. YIM B06819]|nr:hypothetical protein [Sporosarcina sp. YIM B06819]